VRVTVPYIPETSRRVEHIPPEEIQNAMVLIVKNSCGISVEALIDATAEIFGVKRKMDKIRNILSKVCMNCIKKGIFRHKEGQITLREDNKSSWFFTEKCR